MALNTHRRTSLLLLAADICALVLVFNLVLRLRGFVDMPVLWPLGVPVLVFLASLHLIDGYGARSDMLSLDYASLHLIASFFAALTTLLLTYVLIPSGFELQSSRAVILFSFGLLGPLTLGYRRFWYEHSELDRNERKLVFIGNAEERAIFQGECLRLGTLSEVLQADPSGPPDGLRAVLKSVEDGTLVVEAIVLKESRADLPADISLKLVQLFMGGVPTYTLEIFHEVYWRKIPLYRINPIWLFQEGFQIAREPVFERIKRLSDVVLALGGLLGSAVVVGAAALAIKLEDGGPVFFAQTRIGLHRVPFRLLKLRTMRVAPDTGDPYTRVGDARITRVGRFLRSARLDELPQLWNVLRGQMSLIGPRAEWDRLVVDYEREIPSYSFRHMVKPGITGWAQVNYRYGTGIQDTLRKLEYDLYYIRNFSFMLDASIVLKTFHVMLLQRGR